nr:triose phosphate/phosphate translocator, non-green plastid protein [Tanacetum cinerariifolium]
MFGGLFGEKKVEVNVVEVSEKGVGDGEVVAEVAKSKMSETLVLGSLFGLCKGVGFGICQ